jgi:hypothetical protein
MFGSTILDITIAGSMQIEKFRDSVFQITVNAVVTAIVAAA